MLDGSPCGLAIVAPGLMGDTGSNAGYPGAFNPDRTLVDRRRHAIDNPAVPDDQVERHPRPLPKSYSRPHAAKGRQANKPFRISR